MENSTQSAVALLAAIEDQLKQMGLWEDKPPAVEALASVEPFCIDTLQFSQWLQFVFITRLKALLQTGELPLLNSQVTPMAEESFKGSDGMLTRELIKLLAELDRLLSQG